MARSLIEFGLTLHMAGHTRSRRRNDGAATAGVLNRQGPLSTEENPGIVWTCFDGAERQPGGRATVTLWGLER